jgi:hypothetical protein
MKKELHFNFDVVKASKDVKLKKIFCITESFSKNISHQLFDKTITFVNSQH